MTTQLARRIAIGVVITELVGILGSGLTAGAIPDWYSTLVKPWFSPPNWLFAPVWTLLFAMMGIAFGLIWDTQTKVDKDKAYSAFYIQLILNFLWSIIFFGVKQPFLAFLEILMLGLFISICIQEFLKINRTAGLLLVPYLGWVSFATILNLAIVILNF